MGKPVVHFEITSPNAKKLNKFYADLFEWNVQPVPDMPYAMVETKAGKGIDGGIGDSETGESTVTFYVEVDDPQAYLDRVEKLGGKTVVPVTEVPGVVTFAQFADPQGNRIGLVKS